MTVYNPTATRLTPYDTPDDGDDVDAASVGIGLEALGDGLEWASLKLDPVAAASGHIPFAVSRSLTRQVNVAAALCTYALVARSKSASFSGGGAVVVGGPSLGEHLLVQSGTVVFHETPSASNTTGVQFCIDELLHDGSTISSVVASVQGASGHVGLPGTQFSMGLFRKARTVTTLTSLVAAGDFVTDAQVNTTNYQTQHDVTLTPDQNNVVDKSTYTYFLQCWNEYGTNAKEDLKLYGISIAMNAITDMRPG